VNPAVARKIVGDDCGDYSVNNQQDYTLLLFLRKSLYRCTRQMFPVKARIIRQIYGDG
jgi:hypothetical protein